MAASLTFEARGIAETGTTTSSKPLSDFGVDRFSNQDQTSRLVAAFEAAHHDGLALHGDPDAVYRHDGLLTLDGVSFDGRGCTFYPLSDGPQALRCTGSGWRLANVRLLGAAKARTADDARGGLWVGGENDRPASNFVVQDVTVGGVEPGRGVGTAGMMFNNARAGRIIRPIVRASLADGIHNTNGSRNLHFERPLSERTGDDGFAVVSYRPQGRICRDIRVTDGVSRLSAARGFSIVGGSDIVYERCRAERSAAAGVYLYGEESFDTYGVQRCRIIHPVLIDCGTGLNLPKEFRHAALMLGGRDGEDVVDGERIARGAVDCIIESPVIEGVGRVCYAAISTHQYAIRPRILGARVSRILSAPGWPLQSNGIEIGGRDVVVEDPHLTDIVGLPFVVLVTATGRSRIDRPRVTGGRLGAGPIQSFIYLDYATKLQQLTVSDGVFAKGPPQLVSNLLPADKLHLINDRLVR